MNCSYKTVKLGDLCSFHEGYVNPSKTHPEFFGGDVKWLRAVDLNDGYIYETSQTLTKDGFLSAGKSAVLFKPGTLVISKSGSIGKLGILSDYMCGNRATINIIPDTTKVNTLFLFYLLLFNRETIKQAAVGSVQSNLYVPVLKDLSFNFPSLEIQNKIVKYLSSLDNKRFNNEKKIQILDEQIMTFFMNSFLANGENETNLGCITNKQTERVGNKNLKVFSALNSGVLALSEDVFTKQVFSKDISKYIIVKKKWFAYNPARINIGSIGFNDFDFDGCVSPVYVVFSVNEDLVPFFNILIKSSYFRSQVELRASGSVRQSLNYDDFALIPIKFPNPIRLSEFNKIFAKTEKLKKSMIVQNENLLNIRNLLLGQIMSGEIDLAKM